MKQLNPEFLTKSGKKYDLLPYDEFLKIQEFLEDLEDLQDLRAAKEEEGSEPSISLEELKQMF